MNRIDKTNRDIPRQTFLELAGMTPLAMGVGALARMHTPVTAAHGASRPGGTPGDRPYSILFILTDQERYFDPAALPHGYALPGHERLKRRGVTFTNHHINSAVCTSLRTVIVRV